MLNSQISNDQLYKFNRVMDLISMFYVDTVQENKLVEKAIISVLKDLDPHSIYINKEDVQELNEPLIGSFDGIGITFNVLHDTVYVISTYNGGPSERMGIKSGDRIISIDNKQIAGIGINNDDVKKHLVGGKGSIVSLQIKSPENSELKSYQLIREQIPIHSIDAAYQVNESTAYIKLNKFSSTAVEEFTNSAQNLKNAGVKNLILDLRDNGGGYLKAATDLADQFLNDKKLIVYTQGVSSPKYEYYTKTKGVFEKGKLIILINEGTASASEIVCGAIQDWDKGLLIGRRSFGKGLVQRPFTLTDGSMIRLTIARYYTPTGRLIQKPYNEGYDEYIGDIGQRIKHGELFFADSIQFKDSLKYYTLLNNRPVYGGGGIMPDIFIPLDTTMYPPNYSKMMRNGKLFEFVLDFVDKNRKNLNAQYPDFAKFNKEFFIEEEFIRDLMKFSILENIQNKLTADELLAVQVNTSFEFSENHADYFLDNVFIRNHLKALIAQDLYGISEYFEILNSSDKAFLKAIEVINNDSQYQSLLYAN